MTKDFAKRGGSAKPAKQKPRAASGRGRTTPTRGNKKSPPFTDQAFHPAQFSVPSVVLLAAYLPEWMETPESIDIA